jgi:regulator-associated protein of mTOR
MQEAQVTALTTLYNTVDTSKLLLSDIRHGLRITFENNDGEESGLVSKWRQKDRLKTTAVALVVCLNIGVDPPDVIKISPCARMECWIDPLSMQAPKALDTIGKNLQAQYERWQPRAKYKMHLDPTTDDVKKLVTSCRRSAKSERVLFHYNGHGVPRPTANGEIWVFNKSYTQYIPLSIYDLQSWMGNPAIYIFDCSIAGQILSSFKQFSSGSRDQWQDGQDGVSKSDSSNPLQDVILMCACSDNELLPQEPNFPADVFTACLTTPIKIALHWFCSKSLLGNEGITKELIDRVPGKQTDRKTPLGELNWIFTAITDTIAWNVLPRSLFQKLFRQDLLVASLFRNFLLAQRIMRSVGCTPVSHPRLPLMDQHPMWLAWDMAAETCLLQLPDIVDDSRGEKEYVPSPFFSEQLTAFELWLDHGSADKPPPEQLPIVLQVLLSQVHRLRALILLGRFIDMGSWAVDLALSVGIFPYILKLLQTSAMDLRQTLVFIWAKIVSWDMNSQVQNDLTKDGGYLYFIKHLELEDSDIFPESRAQAAFILSAICKNNKKGQLLCAQAGLLQTCCSQIPAIAAAMASAVTSDGGQQMELLLSWLLICVGQLCEDVPEIVNLAYEHHLFDSLMDLASADSPNIRAAAIYSLGTAFNVGGNIEVSEEPSEIEKSVICRVLEGVYDGSPLVRGETVRTLYRAAASHPSWLNRELAVALKQNMASRRQMDVACMSAPDLTQLHYQSSSLQPNLPSQKEVGTSLPHVDDEPQVPSIQGTRPINIFL